MKQTLEFKEDDIKQAIAEYATRLLGKVVTLDEVELKIVEGTKGYNQLDAGTPARLDVKVVTDFKPIRSGRTD